MYDTITGLLSRNKATTSESLTATISQQIDRLSDSTTNVAKISINPEVRNRPAVRQRIVCTP